MDLMSALRLDRELVPALPIGRVAQLDEVAALVLFLVGPGASYITGAHVAVDGGLLTTT